MNTRFSTAQAKTGERFAFWRDMARRHFVPLHIEPLGNGDFNGAARLRTLADLDVALIRADPMAVSRTAKHIEHSAQNEYFVGLQLTGKAVAEHRDRRLTLGPGDFALFDSARPYRIAFLGANGFEHLIIRVPRELLERRCADIARATGIAVRDTDRRGGLVTPILKRLTGLRDIDDGIVDGIIDPALDLLAYSLTLTAGLPGIRERHGTRTLNDIKRYTVSHHAESELSPARAASACSISVRQLHRLFADDSATFGEFLRETRLQQCRRDLSDPRLWRVPIAEIARSHGYRSSSVFTRAFTSRFGVGPRAFRARHHEQTLTASDAGRR
jgi:AraC-like DNA-binding protein